MAFHHNKDNDMLKLICTVSNLNKICLHCCTSSKFCLSTDSNKDLFSNVREDMVGGPSMVFTRKAVVDKIHIRKSTTVYRSVVGVDSSQLYPYSMCKPMPPGLRTT